MTVAQLIGKLQALNMPDAPVDIYVGFSEDGDRACSVEVHRRGEPEDKRLYYQGDSPFALYDDVDTFVTIASPS